VNLKDYIRGQRHGKEANRLEREAMDDSFLQDAIDGFDSVAGDHVSVIEKLEKQLSSPRKRSGRQMWIWAAAAAIVLLTGIPLLLRLSGTKEDIIVAASDVVQQEEEIALSLLQKDTVLTASLSEPEEAMKSTTRHSEPEKEEYKAPEVKQMTTPLLPDEAFSEAFELVAKEDTGIFEELPIAPDKIFVSGRIVDETGEPLTGVTVSLPNTLTGTVTDTTGNFQLAVPKDGQKTLIASYIGMKNSEIPLKENAENITMKEDNMALSEVAVVAYGRQRKEDLTGRVSVVTDTPSFGEEEFRKYFIENYDKHICAEQEITITVEFFIGLAGKPTQITIKENPCPLLDNEIKRLLLGSPAWSKPNRKASLQIKLPKDRD
jgi:hypothetical protein